eukprot:14726748-Alexandrium_andersonii.AAC.1
MPRSCVLTACREHSQMPLCAGCTPALCRALRAEHACSETRMLGSPVSYTHLTLPTICSV